MQHTPFAPVAGAGNHRHNFNIRRTNMARKLIPTNDLQEDTTEQVILKQVCEDLGMMIVTEEQVEAFIKKLEEELCRN